MKYLFILSALFLAVSCTVTHEATDDPNPYDKLTWQPPVLTVDKPDSNTIQGLHQYIFAVKCANPGCHDGNFEPDFRTVQSAYSSLVYQPIVKSDGSGNFRYRVLPGDHLHSWLHLKLTTEDAIITRMPAYDKPLNASEMKAVRSWIDNGARDIFGNPAELPDPQPLLYGIAAFEFVDTTQYRVDSLRIDNQTYNSFAMVKRSGGYDFTKAEIWIGVVDNGKDSTGIQDFKYNTLKISDNIDDFSNARSYQATLSAVPKIVPKYYGNQTAYFIWKAAINPQDFETNKTYYMRYYVQDEGHAKPTELPNANTPYQIKTFASFYTISQ